MPAPVVAPPTPPTFLIVSKVEPVALPPLMMILSDAELAPASAA
jgi:hypothetical protein